MLILTGSVVDGKTEALCSVCHRVVGLFEQSELGEMCKGLDAIYCFDCDPGGAESVHSIFHNMGERFLVYIDQTPISINLWGEVRAKAQVISQKNIQLAKLYEHLMEVFQR